MENVVQVMTAFRAVRIAPAPRCGEHPVPARVARGVGQFACNGIRQPGLAPHGRQILLSVLTLEWRRGWRS
jgi:hypothetical protein